MPIGIRPFDAALGAEIHGVDLSKPVDDETFAAIEDAYNEYSVLLFRSQDMNEAQHVDFSRRFGPLEIHVLDQYLHPRYPEILVVSNVEEGGRNIGIKDAGRYWHTDLSYMVRPSRGSLLYAIEVPHADDGEPLGDTLFASSAAAYEALPDSRRAQIDALSAEFSLANKQAKLVTDGDKSAARTDTHPDKTPPVVHKIVRTHPLTGRRSIYVNEGHTSRIVGISDDEGRALLGELYAHVTKDEFVYRHKWRKGDLLIWDNIPTQHIAICDYALPQRRMMHRTTIAGSAPI